MKKILAMLLSVVMVLALCACGSQTAAPAAPEAPAQEAPAAQTDSEAAVEYNKSASP